jgi:NADH:ubiquinone oxidoreductase subunit E
MEDRVDLGPAEQILVETEETDDGSVSYKEQLIPILQKIQQSYGYLPGPVLTLLSSRSGIPMSRIYGVISFYAQFYLEPHGKHTVLCCRGTACHVRGGNKVLRAVSDGLDIDVGQTTDDGMFSLETVACLGACAVSPVMVVDETYYGKMTPQLSGQILQRIAGEDS